jgi:hypothetical protein
MINDFLFTIFYLMTVFWNSLLNLGKSDILKSQHNSLLNEFGCHNLKKISLHFE